jgi:hypothetical protein
MAKMVATIGFNYTSSAVSDRIQHFLTEMVRGMSGGTPPLSMQPFSAGMLGRAPIAPPMFSSDLFSQYKK